MSSRHLNIIHFGKFYEPYTGGIESVTSSLAAGAAARGHHVEVVCFGEPAGDAPEVISGVRVDRHRPSFKTMSQPLGLGYAVACIRKAWKRDVVHLHYPNMLAAMCALLVPPWTRVVVHWHSDVVGKGLAGIVVRPLEFLLALRATMIIATSENYSTASPIIRHFRRRTRVIPIGCPDYSAVYRGLTLQRAELEASLPALRGRHVVLAVGRLVEFKGFDVLVDAASALRDDAVVVIVGEGPAKADLERAIADKGLEDRVLLVGRQGPLRKKPLPEGEPAFVSERLLASLFHHASLLAFPSVERAESFGVSMIEAMSFGLAVVASDIPGSGVGWVSQDGATGYSFPVRDSQALADRCNKILSDAALRDRFSRGSSDRYKNLFRESTSVDRVCELYAEISR